MPQKRPSSSRQQTEIDELRAQLAEARETLEAIRTGAVDGVVVTDAAGDHIFSLAGAETPYRSLIETIQEGALLLRSDGTIIYANHRFAEMTGRPLLEVVGKPWGDFFIPAHRAQANRMLVPAAGHPRGELALMVHGGGELPVQVSLATVPADPTEMRAAILTDLTERKQAERTLRQANELLERRVEERTTALRRSEERFRLIADTSPLAIYAFEERDQTGVYINPTFTSLFGYDLDDVPNVGAWWPRAYPDEAYRKQVIEEWSRRVQQVKSQHPAIEPIETVVTCKDGTTRNIQWGYVTTPTQNYAFGLDLTARKQVEAQLRTSEEIKFQTIFDGASDGILLADLTTRKFILSNVSMRRMLGYTAEEFVRLGVEDIHPPEDHGWIMRQFDRMIRDDGDAVLTDLPVRRKDGAILHVSLGTALITLSGTRYLAGFFRDTTERRRSELALRESEARYRTLVDNLPIAVVLADKAGRVLAANPMAARLQGGKRPEDLVGLLLSDLVAPGERARVMQMFGNVMNSGVIIPFESRIEHADGSVIPAELGGVILRDADGQPTGLLALAQDLTERKQAQRDLVESEARYRLLVESLPLGVLVMDPAQKILMANQAAAKLVKARSAGELIGRSGRDFIVPDQQSAVPTRAADLVERGFVTPTEGEFLCVDGSRVPVETRAVELTGPDGTSVEILGIAENISSRKRARAQAAAREAIWRLFLEAESLEAIYQRLAEELAGRLGFPIAAVELYDPARDEMIFVGVSGMSEFPLGLRVPASQTRSGAVVHAQRPAADNRADERTQGIHAGLLRLGVRTFICAPFGGDGQVAGALVLADCVSRDDLTAWMQDLETIAQTLSLEFSRRRMEEALRHSEEEFRAMFELASIGMAEVDVRTEQWLRVNRKLCEITGYAEAELLRMRAPDLTIAEDQPKDRAALQCVLRGDAPDYRHEKRYLRKDGRQAWVHENLTIIRDADGRPVRTITAIEDVTAKKEMESQFFRAQRLESIGALASGVAHDLNNTLTPVLLLARLLRASVTDEKGRTRLDVIENSAQRGSNIIKQLLTFARGQPEQRVLLEVRHLLRDMEKFVRETFPRDIEVRVATDPALWPFFGDPTQVHQSLLNLCVNARDAMPEGGKLRLEASNVNIDETFAAMTPGAKPGTYVCVRVTDTGTGITPENLDRIFDPFFTTKEVGKGTGLGLSTVLGIVRGHGGFVRVGSQPGQGTTIELYFPAPPDAKDSGPEAPAQAVARGSGELVLVVDDEPEVREGVRVTLEANGYKVLIASHGAEALGLFSQHRAGIAAVLTDAMMPVMGGATMVLVLRGMAPTLPVIIMTGVTDQKNLKNLEAVNASALITKPFLGEELLLVLDNVLHHRAPPAGGVD